MTKKSAPETASTSSTLSEPSVKTKEEKKEEKKGKSLGESIADVVHKVVRKKSTPHAPVVIPLVVDNAAKKTKKTPIIDCSFARERVVSESSPYATELYNSSAYGTLLADGKLQLSLAEALYLMEKKRIAIYDGRKKLLDFEGYVRRASRVEPKFWTKYAVYKDMRNRGYIVKTALKFGADFRVYDRGIKPGEDHARWIVYPVHEGEQYTWFDFAAKNRVAHSTKKRLMMGVVDGENDVTYWEIKWVRP